MILPSLPFFRAQPIMTKKDAEYYSSRRSKEKEEKEERKRLGRARAANSKLRRRGLVELQVESQEVEDSQEVECFIPGRRERCRSHPLLHYPYIQQNQRKVCWVCRSLRHLGFGLQSPACRRDYPGEVCDVWSNEWQQHDGFEGVKTNEGLYWARC